MSEGGSKGRGCLMAAIGAGLFVAVSCGCSGIVAVTMGPSMLVDAMVESEPLDVTHPASPEPAKTLKQRSVDELRSASHTTRFTGPELTKMLQDQLGDKGSGGVSISDSLVTFDLSMNLAEKPADPPQWVNVHVVGNLTFEDGAVTAAHFEEAEFSGWDLGMYLGDDAEVVRSLNREIGQRMGDPDVRKAVNAVERLTVAGDAIELTVTPEGAEQVQDAR